MDLDRQSRADPGGYVRGRGARRGRARFESARRVFRIIDLVSRHEGVTAKAISRELGIGLSTCYYLINILLEEGYLSRCSPRRGYHLGPAVSTLHGRASADDLDSRLEPVIGDLARRSRRHAYLGIFSGGEVEVSRVEAPPKSPPVGIVRGFHGASHALALGKILMAHSGGADGYVANVGLEAFTPRTIVRPDLFRAHLERVRRQGFAADVEEFAENLCCVAAPIVGRTGEVKGAVGVSTSFRRFADDVHPLVEMVRRAADDASALLKEGTGG